MPKKPSFKADGKTGRRINYQTNGKGTVADFFGGQPKGGDLRKLWGARKKKNKK